MALATPAHTPKIPAHVFMADGDAPPSSPTGLPTRPPWPAALDEVGTRAMAGPAAAPATAGRKTRNPATRTGNTTRCTGNTTGTTGTTSSITGTANA